jgi:hypothetical protein
MRVVPVRSTDVQTEGNNFHGALGGSTSYQASDTNYQVEHLDWEGTGI